MSGVAATQLARHFGLRVVGTAGAAKKEFVESLGAVHVPRGPRLAERVRESAPGGRVDAVFDLVGGAELPEVAGLLSDRTKLIIAAAKETVGELGGAPVARARTAAVLAELARLAAAGVLRPPRHGHLSPGPRGRGPARGGGRPCPGEDRDRGRVSRRGK